jgi:hypothetical protein
MATLNMDINSEVISKVRPNMKLNLDDPATFKDQENQK